MPASPQHGLWLHPQWLVSAAALAALGVIASYDLRLGLAFGAVLGLFVAAWLYVALRFGSLSGAPASGRHALVTRFQVQASNRRRAVLRTELTAMGSDPQPPKRR